MLRLRLAAAGAVVVLWGTFSTALFTGSAGLISVIREDVMNNWGGLGPKIARVSLLSCLGSWAWALIGALLFSCAFMGIGDLLLRRLSMARELRDGNAFSRVAYLTSAFTVGQGLLAVAFLALAMLGLLLPACTALVLMAGIAASIYAARVWTAEHVPSRLPLWQWWQESSYRPLLALAIAAIGLSIFFVTSRMSFDASAAYFSNAKLTALSHRAEYFTSPGFVTSYFQSTINYAAIIQLFGDQSARVYSWLAGLSVILLAMALAAELGLNGRARVILLVLIVSSTFIMDLMGDGKADLISAAPALAAVYWVVANADQRRDGHVVAGLLAGMAMAARPFNLFLMPAIIALIGLLEPIMGQHRKEPQHHRALLARWGWMGVGVVPWLAWTVVANWGIVGDPLGIATEYLRLRSGAYPGAFPRDAVWEYRILYPLTVTFINNGQSLGNISPLFVGLMPLLLIDGVRNGMQASRRLRVSLSAVVLTLALWLIGTATFFETRYVIFLWIVLYMPSALWIAAALQNAGLFIRVFVGLMLVSVLGFIAVRTIYFAVDTYSPVDAAGNAHCYDMDRCVPLQIVNERAEPGQRVLMLNAFRYYLRTDLLACSSTHEDYDILAPLSRSDMGAFWTEVYRRGYRYVVYQWDYTVFHLYFGAIPSPGNAPAWLDLVPVYGKAGEKQVVYRLEATNPPLPREKYCQKDASGIWQVKPGTPPAE